MTATGEWQDNAVLLLEIKELLVTLVEKVDGIEAKMIELEAEFGPLARKASRLAAAASTLPGAGWRRKT